MSGWGGLMYSEISEVEFLSCLFCLHVITADILKLHSSNQDLKASFQQILILIVLSGGRQKNKSYVCRNEEKIELERVLAFLSGRRHGQFAWKTLYWALMLRKSQMHPECFQTASSYTLKEPILKLWLTYEPENAMSECMNHTLEVFSLQSITLPSTTSYKSIDEMLRVYLATAETWSGEKESNDSVYCMKRGCQQDVSLALQCMFYDYFYDYWRNSITSHVFQMKVNKKEIKQLQWAGLRICRPRSLLKI